MQIYLIFFLEGYYFLDIQYIAKYIDRGISSCRNISQISAQKISFYEKGDNERKKDNKRGREGSASPFLQLRHLLCYNS